jgi:uncharacterized protein DUF7008/Eco57I restriction-modification methylase
MIERQALVADLRHEVTALEDDMRRHIDATPELAAQLRSEHQRAQAAHRTAMSLTEWRDEEITQAAVAWVLGCVFVRFLEDNELIDQPLLSGPGSRLDAARGQREIYFERNPQESDREYLLWMFAQVAQYPAVAPLYDPRHTPLRRIAPSVDGARQLREMWQRIDPDTGELVHDFSDPSRSTRFLGDLYQDLSEAAQKRYALLQTPEFVEEFILDRTLDPALDEFGLSGLRMIDPTCGSGHFLLGAFHRLLARWREREPLTNVRVLAQHALDHIYGVDLNPYATAIARFRLLIEAMIACEITRLPECPDFKLNLATGDSLLHGPEPGQFAGFVHYRAGIAHVYQTEDAPELSRIFGQGYHVVVGNPPYINVADSALRDAYRGRYRSCHGKYALSVPFMERFFELAHPQLGEQELAGYVGQITANSFMKREFGAPLIEQFLPTVDLTTLIDTSGAYIPGHGTPTVILLGRARPPISSTIRVLDAVRGEPSQPADPAHGLVWESILGLVDQAEEQNRFIRAGDVERAELSAHPMTLGVGRELRKSLEREHELLDLVAESHGVVSISAEDDAYVRPSGRWRSAPHVRGLVTGDIVRDWRADVGNDALFPYDDSELEELATQEVVALWPLRSLLWSRQTFGRKTYREEGRTWYEWHQTTLARLQTPLTITWGEVATHNHFVLDRGGKVFKQTAPVIKLPVSASEDDHLRLLGVLNSSTACFWLKQVCQPKGGDYVGQEGARVSKSPWEDRFAFNASNVAELPLPQSRPLALPQRLDKLACERGALLDLLTDAEDLHATAQELASRDADLFAQMISLQEELDWEILAAYGLVDDSLPCPCLDAPPIQLGERAFEIVLARQMAQGEVETTWFERHRSTAITEPPAHWPAAYREVVEQRIALIESDIDVGLIERPEHKRRWSGIPPFEGRLRERLERMVLDRLEAGDLWGPEPRLRSLSELTDVVRRDRRLVAACELIAGSQDADPGEVVAGLVLGEAVPFLAALRHTDSGMRKRAEWERVWDLQREEDAIDALVSLPENDPQHITAEQAERRKRDEVGTIAVPPRYAKPDFRTGTGWRLRGKLDVPKERFTLYSGAERGAGGPALGWAGWDELQKATALAARIVELQSEEAADQDRLTPLLAGILELLPWIHQWHPVPDPRYGQAPGVFFESWLDGTLSALGLTRDELTGWQPPAPQRGRRRRTAVSAR